jgi:GntR family transcriptional repressor for pyruvate dehydrogenase complex
MDPIERISDVATAASRLRNLITSGTLAKGEKLPAGNELTAQLRVSRPAVHEAVAVMQALGYLKISHGETFVADPDEAALQSTAHWFSEHVEQMGDYMEARQAIESAAARLAAQRASQQEIRQLEEIHRAFEEAESKEDVVGLAEADKAFHDAVIRATHNRVLTIINHRLERAFEKYRIRSFSMQESRPATLTAHRNIIDSIESRDPDRAEVEMKHHLDVGFRNFASSGKSDEN